MTESKKLNFILIIFYVLSITLLSYSLLKPDQETPAQKNTQKKAEIIPEPEITMDEFGLVIDSLNILEDYVKRNETLGLILSRFNVTQEKLNIIAANSTDIFDIRRINQGKPYYAYLNNDDLKYFVYAQDQINYIVFDLEDSVKIYAGKKDVTIKRKAITGKINHSLYAALTQNNASPELVIKLSQVYAWQIDFYRIQKGDNFKVIYEEEYVGEQQVGVGKIIGAFFNHNGEDFYAINYTQDNTTEYFDEKGNSLRRAFLKAPLEYSRISSRYSKNRFHPVQKRFKAHLGTDYAAPTGTPIRTVGDGTIMEASFTRGNGNYVKVRHNGTYTTQYLHMSRIGKGIKRGTKVKQGDIIGYVGSTGLATGPHLCFRFWKNGVQVDPFKEQLPASHPVKNEYMETFTIKKNKIMDELNKLKIPGSVDIKNTAA